ncbi:unnamed protein product [Closterium sp. Yama58-4]|nr:unnamed protein product [Closterium sp. Yama58-4]
MRPVICLQRCGLSALMGGKTEATTADVLYYFMMNAPTAYKRLMRAAKEAGTHGGDALATAELHLEAYGRQFDARANSGINGVTGIMEKADIPIEGLVYNFPPYKEDKKGKIRPVRGNGWGGARRGKAFESPDGDKRLPNQQERTLRGLLQACSLIHARLLALNAANSTRYSMQPAYQMKPKGILIRMGPLRILQFQSREGGHVLQPSRTCHRTWGIANQSALMQAARNGGAGVNASLIKRRVLRPWLNIVSTLTCH